MLQVNSLERYLGMLKGERVDHVPRIPIVMQYAAERIGSNYGEFASDFQVLVEANRRCAREFGFDQLSAISDPYRETEGFGGKITYVRDGVPRCTHPLENSKDLSFLLKPDSKTSTRMADRIRAIEDYRRLDSKDFSIMGWVEGPAAEAADLRDVANFMMDTIEDSGFVADLMDICTQAGISFAKAQVAAGADTIGIGDAVASQLPPETYETLIQQREKLLVDAIHSSGALVRLHICGNITHLLPGIAGLDVDILDVDHMVDLAAVREAVGPRVAISGNIDPVSGVLRGTPASIRSHVVNSYRIVGNPFMVNAGCEIPAGTPSKNLLALCEPLDYMETTR